MVTFATRAEKGGEESCDVGWTGDPLSSGDTDKCLLGTAWGPQWARGDRRELQLTFWRWEICESNSLEVRAQCETGLSTAL